MQDEKSDQSSTVIKLNVLMRECHHWVSVYHSSATLQDIDVEYRD